MLVPASASARRLRRSFGTTDVAMPPANASSTAAPVCSVAMPLENVGSVASWRNVNEKSRQTIATPYWPAGSHSGSATATLVLAPGLAVTPSKCDAASQASRRVSTPTWLPPSGVR